MDLIIENFKIQTVSPLLWCNSLTFGIVGILSIFFLVGLCSKLAIIRYILKFAPKRPINQNILIDQVIHSEIQTFFSLKLTLKLNRLFNWEPL